MDTLVSLELFLPRRIVERLREEAEKAGTSEEELLVEVLSERFGERLDPDTEIEMHLRLSEKELMEAEEFLRKGDLVQASEKAWGAAAQIVKAVAAREGKELRSHAELWRFVDEVARRLNDVELRRLWRTANALHQNFYENWMPPDDVKYAIEDVKEFIEKLRKLLQQ
ncbi:MAG: hypothetical protein AT718_04660 [Vulcanisaeta sp. JCHS_4]|jgi:PaREP1/PaREP8 domain containing family protein|nr:MAG: hypothetical protein AT718_04660 [Vulcanisaeta sp. JCHS_4]